MNQDRNQFYKVAQQFFDLGLMNEIYSSDKLCVCNVANVGYYVFSYDSILNGNYQFPIGVSFQKDIIEDIINNNDNWYTHIKAAGKDYVNKYLVSLSPKVMDVMLKLKNERDINGPGPNIDYEWEERIKNRNKSL